MMRRTNLETAAEALASVLFAVAVIQFSTLADPWVPILLGAASAISLTMLRRRVRTITFALIACLSLLPGSPWIFTQSTASFAFAGMAMSILAGIKPSIAKSRLFRRSIQSLPLIVIGSMMPIPSSLRSVSDPRIALLDAGVWATATQLPEDPATLSTKYQYTYERFRDSLRATVIKPTDNLEGFDQLVIVTPTTPFEPAFVKSVEKWTSGGGKLLIVADHTNLFGHQTVLKSLTGRFGIGLRPDALYETETNGGVYSNPFIRMAGLTPCSIEKGVVPRLTMIAWSEHPDYTATSFFGELDPTDDDGAGRFPVLGSRRIGLGEVTLFTDSTFFANFANHRWSSQILLGSVFWSVSSSIMVIAGGLSLVGSFRRGCSWFLPIAILFVVASPMIGFRCNTSLPTESIVKLSPPPGVANESEERDKGNGSALLASAYAFGVGIEWDSDYSETFGGHMRKNGLPLTAEAGMIPVINVQELATGRFYIDQNSFWFGQGVGLLRLVNMANFWKSLGARDRDLGFSVMGSTDIAMTDPDGRSEIHRVQKFQADWVLIDERIVGRWIPESSSWLARKEWQFGPWFDKDLIFKPTD